jgi:hypothetical protein
MRASLQSWRCTSTWRHHGIPITILDISLSHLCLSYQRSRHRRRKPRTVPEHLPLAKRRRCRSEAPAADGVDAYFTACEDARRRSVTVCVGADSVRICAKPYIWLRSLTPKSCTRIEVKVSFAPGALGAQVSNNRARVLVWLCECCAQAYQDCP